MKKFIYFLCIFSCTITSSCVDIGRYLVNENGNQYDIDERILIPDSLIPCKDFYFKGEKIALSDPYFVHVDFGLPIGINEDDIQTYNSNLPRLKYHLSIPCPVLPTVKLNSFSFTNTKGEIIPSILYYRTDGRVVNIIDSLPVIFTDSLKKEMKIIPLTIFAECSQSEHDTKEIFINYDIEVGDKRFVEQIKYRQKLYFDWRPKFW